jgi:hypothetical protein
MAMRDTARRKGRANIAGVCPECHKPYSQVGNYNPDSICQCKRKENDTNALQP